MADQSFPQIPATVWWGMRQLLQRTPSAKFDDGMIAASLGVQPAAARQYVAELKRIGILDDEGKATEIANLWRMDLSYGEAVEAIVSGAYPEQLTTIAPPGNADRQTVVNWFMQQGLGEGSARNKAATYLLVSSAEPNTTSNSSTRKDSKRNSGDDTAKPLTAARRTRRSTSPPMADKPAKSTADIMPLNVNVQIHISADAGNDQIESIFAAMRKYLKDD